MREKWTSGSIQWDIWALAAIILECDMPQLEYYAVKCEKQAKDKAKKHFESDNVSKSLYKLIEKIILKPLMMPKYTLNDIEESIR